MKIVLNTDEYGQQINMFKKIYKSDEVQKEIEKLFWDYRNFFYQDISLGKIVFRFEPSEVFINACLYGGLEPSLENFTRAIIVENIIAPNGSGLPFDVSSMIHALIEIMENFLIIKDVKINLLMPDVLETLRNNNPEIGHMDDENLGQNVVQYIKRETQADCKNGEDFQMKNLISNSLNYLSPDGYNMISQNVKRLGKNQSYVYGLVEVKSRIYSIKVVRRTIQQFK